MSLTVGDRLGHYEVTAQIGVGGMGEVYRARDTKLDRDVAIKVLPKVLPKVFGKCNYRWDFTAINQYLYETETVKLV